MRIVERKAALARAAQAQAYGQGVSRQAGILRGAGDNFADQRGLRPSGKIAHLAVLPACGGAVICDQFGRGSGFQMLKPAGYLPAFAGVGEAGAEAFDVRDLGGEQRLQLAGRKLGRDREIGVAAAAARADNDLAFKRGKAFNQNIGNNRQTGDYTQQITVERCIRRDNIHIQPQFAQRGVAGESGPQRGQPGALRLDAGHPVGLVIEHQRGACGRRSDCAQRGNIARRRSGFRQPRRGHAVWPQQPGVMLFLRLRELPPAEIADQFGPVCHRLQRPQADHARQRSGVVARPVDRAGLLFEHPPASALRAAPVEVVVESGNVGVALAGIGQLVRFAERKAVEEAERVAVPAQRIQIAAQIVMIVFGEKPHRVVGDVAAR